MVMITQNAHIRGSGVWASHWATSPGVIVLIDDMGFGASSAYGGPCAMTLAVDQAGKHRQRRNCRHDEIVAVAGEELHARGARIRKPSC
jgi:hypothetical protein